jgi:hypothetical protein
MSVRPLFTRSQTSNRGGQGLKLGYQDFLVQFNSIRNFPRSTVSIKACLAIVFLLVPPIVRAPTPATFLILLRLSMYASLPRLLLHPITRSIRTRRLNWSSFMNLSLLFQLDLQI